MSRLAELRQRIVFWKTTDRIGPDVPYTHWRLHFRSTMQALCKARFRHFADTAEFRPGAYATSCTNISVGDRVVIRPGCMLFADEHEGITIEDGVMLGAGVHIYVNNHRFDEPDRPIIDQGYYPSRPVILRAGSWIGANAILLPGVVVGENAVVGAGSVVTRDVPPRVVVVGSPARIVRRIGDPRESTNA
jgi:acetyltransferase-like isoleucine patch superfamily enzyme